MARSELSRMNCCDLIGIFTGRIYGTKLRYITRAPSSPRFLDCSLTHRRITISNRDEISVPVELGVLPQGVLPVSAETTGLGDAYVRACCSARCNLLSRVWSMEPERVTGQYTLQWKLWRSIGEVCDFENKMPASSASLRRQFLAERTNHATVRMTDDVHTCRNLERWSELID
jgi:hypothetical protein